MSYDYFFPTSSADPKFLENILDGIKVIVRTGFSYEKFQRELQFFSSAHRLMMVYICTKFHENILEGI